MIDSTEDSGSVARVTSVQFGRVDGILGLHLRLAFSSSQINDYTVTAIEEMEELMDLFRASTLNEILNKKMRIRRYPLPLGSFSPLG